jgi:hypothetical protein
MALAPRAIHVHVERLVLDGFSRGESAAIASAVRAELGRLLTAQGLPPGLARGAALSSVDGGSLRMGAGTRPAAAGKGIARAVYGGLRR